MSQYNDDIKTELNCSFCNEKFTDEIRLIPECGNSVCGKCNQELRASTDETSRRRYQCRACHQEHFMPSDGLPSKKQPLEPEDESKMSLNENIQRLAVSAGNFEALVRKLGNEATTNKQQLIRTLEKSQKLLKEMENEILAHLGGISKSSREIHSPGSNQTLRIKTMPSCTLKTHSDFLSQVLFLADGRLATCSRDNRIKVWRIEEREEHFELGGHTEWVLSLVSLPNDYLASGAADGSIKIWDLERREEIRTIRAHTDAVFGILSLSKGRLASYSLDDTVKIWDLNSEDETPLSTSKGHGRTYMRRQLSLFGVLSNESLVTCSRVESPKEESVLRVWSSSKENPVKSISTGLDDALSLLVLSNDQIAIGFNCGTIKIIDLADEALSKTKEKAHVDCVFSLAQLSNGNLISGGRDRMDMTLRLWVLPSFDLLQSIVTGHLNPVSSMAISADERILVSGVGWDTEVKLWPFIQTTLEDDATLLKTAKKLPVPFTHLSNNVKVVKSQHLIGHYQRVNRLILLPENRLISCSYDTLIIVWDLQNSRILFKFSDHSGSVNALTLMSDGRLASGSSDKTIKIWDLEQRELVKTLTGHSESIVSLFALKNGNLASCSIDGTILVWDLTSESKRPKFEIKGENISLLGILSTDNLLTWSDKQDRKIGGVLKMWNHETGLEIKSYNHRLMRPTAFLVLKNDHVAVGFEDGRVKVIVPGVQMVLAVSKGAHIGPVISLLELPNGNLVSGGRESVVKIWNSTDGRLVLTILTGHAGAVTSLAVSPDALCLFTGSEDATIRSWTCQQLTEVPSLSIGEYRCLAILEQDSCSQTLLLDGSKKTLLKIGKKIILTPTSMSDSSQLSSTIESLRELRHNSLVRVTDVFDPQLSTHDERMMVLFVFENYSEWLSLESYLWINPAKLDASYLTDFHMKTIRWLIQLADALVYLHSKKIVHGNLSTKNVFLESETVVKLGVPDLAGVLLKCDQREIRPDDMRYFSPKRIVSGKSTSYKDDSWSFGCILYEVIERKKVFGGLNFNELSRAISNGDLPELEDENYKPLYLKLLEKQEEHRLNSDEIKEQLEAIKNEMILDESNLDEYLSEKETEPQRSFKYRFIDYDCFKQVSRTEELNLSHNQFTSIQERHFDCLPSGEADEILLLDLSFNRLELIDDAFWRLVNLRSLDLSNNQLEELPSRVFSALTSLKLLNLSRNRLRVLEPSLFKSLRSLDALNLSGNLIKRLNSDVFSALIKLQAFDLSDNQIEDLRPGVFNSQFGLTTLRLDGNLIVSIDSHLFVNTTKLLYLRLNRNQISSIGPGAFRNLTNLRQLDLSFNRIAQVEKSLFNSLAKLKTLNLSSNGLESIEGIEFNSIKQLSQLLLNNNKLQTIDLGSFFQLTRLHELNLSDNCLKAIDIGAWNSSRSMEIDASGNEILLGHAQLELELESNNIHLTFDHIKHIERAY